MSSVLDAEDESGLAEEVHQEAVVLMHRTSAVRASGDWGFDSSAVLERAGVRDGKWFVLGADGSYDVHLNRFGRELDSWGVRSDNGHEGYMRDVMLYCRFLHESRGGKSIWETDSDDLKAYKAVRLRMEGPDTVSASTWRRSIAALDKWVQWSLYEELLTRAPFRYVVAAAEPAEAEDLMAGELEPELLDAFEDHLVNKFPEGSGRPYTILTDIVRLLRGVHEEDGDTFSVEMQARIGFTATTAERPADKPLDAYPLPVLERIEAAALEDVRAIRDRILCGERLAERGEDPESGGWGRLGAAGERALVHRAPRASHPGVPPTAQGGCHAGRDSGAQLVPVLDQGRHGGVPVSADLPDGAGARVREEAPDQLSGESGARVREHRLRQEAGPRPHAQDHAGVGRRRAPLPGRPDPARAAADPARA
ncbi:site-specific integrase [Streptomyces sp. NPDC086182]|uniref:site-specific integrase n=1 Tax=Streptomyces sp. NPDC086182 TaxID=3155058 RepID=UPI0034420101